MLKKFASIAVQSGSPVTEFNIDGRTRVRTVLQLGPHAVLRERPFVQPENDIPIVPVRAGTDVILGQNSEAAHHTEHFRLDVDMAVTGFIAASGTT